MLKCCQKITTSTLCTVPYQLLLARDSTQRKCTMRDNINTVFFKKKTWETPGNLKPSTEKAPYKQGRNTMGQARSKKHLI